MRSLTALTLLAGGVVAIAIFAELADKQEVTNGQWLGFLRNHDELFV